MVDQFKQGRVGACHQEMPAIWRKPLPEHARHLQAPAAPFQRARLLGIGPFGAAFNLA